jgi:hypothetical protein
MDEAGSRDPLGYGEAAESAERQDAMDEDQADEGQGEPMELGMLGLLDDDAAEVLISQLGGSGKQFAREKRQAWRRTVTELYSLARVTAAAKSMPRYGLIPGMALDLTTTDAEGVAWDFDKDEIKEKAKKLINDTRPMFVIGSPMCTAFSTWQYLNRTKRDPALVKREWRRAVAHMEFVSEVYQMQISSGRFFLHEHPEWATSWQLPAITRILDQEDVSRVRADQCQYGAAVTFGALRGAPIFKPTGFMSNSPAILRQLQLRCGGRGGLWSKKLGQRHALCSREVAKAAAI